MELRTCKMCKKELPLTDFANAGIVKGVQYYRHKCVKCYSKFKEKRKKRILVEVRNFKKDLKCEVCGYDDFRALQFHHHNANKEHSVANMRGHALETILREASKCKVLCANCHQIEHYRDIA